MLVRLMFLLNRVKNSLDPINILNINFIRRVITNRAAVLDYGAGRSQYQPVITDLGAKYFVYEPNREYDNDERIEFFHCTKGQKVVLLLDVIQHVENVDRILSDVTEHMTGSTTLIITYPFLFPICENNDFQRWSRAGISHLLERHSLEIVCRSYRGGIFSCIIELVRMYFINSKPLQAKGWFQERRSFKWFLRGFIEAFFLIPRFVCFKLDSVIPDNGVYIGEILEVRKKSK
jgi:hypothetical protein